MTIAIDQANIGTNTESGSDTDIAFNTTQNVASGGFIVAIMGVGEAQTFSSVANSGTDLGWTIQVQGNGGSPYGIALAWAQAPSGLASGTTITATLAGAAQYKTLGAMSFTGVAAASPVDVAGTVQNSATSAWSSGSLSLAAGSVLVAGSFIGLNVLSGITSPSIEAFDFSNVTPAYSSTGGYRIEASAGSYAVAGTWGGTDTNLAVGVAFKAAAGPVLSQKYSWHFT